MLKKTLKLERNVHASNLPKQMRSLAPAEEKLPAGTELEVSVDTTTRTASVAFKGFKTLATFNQLPEDYPALTLRMYTEQMGKVFSSQDSERLCDTIVRMLSEAEGTSCSN